MANRKCKRALGGAWCLARHVSGLSIEQDAAAVARLDLIAIDRQAHNNGLETHGQPDGVTAGVVAEHIA